MHIIRQQAAFDLQISAGEHGYITEQDIDNYLIANHEPEEGEEDATEAMRQKVEAISEMTCKYFARDGLLHVPPQPRLVPRPIPEKHEWVFFYRSLQAEPATRAAILTRMCSGTTPKFKSELRTQRATTLSERIGKKQHAVQAAIRKQRNVNAIIDTGAQVTTMPESAVNRMPAAHNHRDAPPGTAVKYGNGEIETIE